MLSQKIRCHMKGVQGFINLVPGHGLIAGNMIGIAYGMGIAHKPHVPPGKIRGMGERPQGGAVPWYDDRFSIQYPL